MASVKRVRSVACNGRKVRYGFISKGKRPMSEQSETVGTETYQLFKTDLCGFCYRVRAFFDQNGIDIPVFEALVRKRVILHDQSLNLILKENQVQSVDGVNGPSLKIGSMDEVNTNGNWPKNYSKDK